MGRGSTKPWYKDGLRFECTQCGACCTGEPGLVQFTTEEGRNMAAQLGMELNDFLGLYASKSPDEDCWMLDEIYTGEAHDCVLLGRCNETGKTWCIAHDSRPAQCRTWPFWPDNMKSKKCWDQAGLECEGIGRGPIIPLRVIQEEMALTPDWGTTS